MCGVGAYNGHDELCVGVALLLQLCLGRLVELQPDKTCWILATAQLHLYHASFKEAFQSLLRTGLLSSLYLSILSNIFFVSPLLSRL